MSDDEEKSVTAPEVAVDSEPVTDLSNSDVCTKYQEASKVVNLTLEGLVTQTIVGAKVLDLCAFGTTVMEAATSKLYTKKLMEKQLIEVLHFLFVLVSTTSFVILVHLKGYQKLLHL